MSAHEPEPISGDAMSPPTQVHLATISRFHYPDTAAFLHHHGVDVTLHTGLWAGRIRHPVLPDQRIMGHPGLQIPYMAAARLMPALEPHIRWISDIAQLSLDRRLAERFSAATDPRFIRNPDPEARAVYVALSGCGARSGAAAQRRGWQYVCERGSFHISVSHAHIREEADRHGVPCPHLSRRMELQEQEEYALSDRLIVASTVARNSFHNTGIPMEKIRVLPLSNRILGKNVFTAVNSLPPRPPLPDRPFRIVFVGAISLIKGIPYLLEAAKRADLPNWSLTLVGAMSRNGKALCAKADPQRVHFTGPLPYSRVLDIIGKSHCLVLPSIEDGFGLVAAEAMSLGTPPIVSESCGVADLITDGVSGRIVPTRSVDALAEALTQLARAPDQGHAMGIQAQQAIVRQMGEGIMIDRWMDAVFEPNPAVIGSNATLGPDAAQGVP